MSVANRGILLKQIDRLFSVGTLSAVGEAQLLDRYLSQRDELAFEALVDRHGPMVLSLCRRMLRDPRDIEDAFQATFLILVRKAPSIRDRDQISSWLYGVAYKVANRARGTTIRRRNRESTLDTAILDSPAHTKLDLDHLDLDSVFDEELARLPEKYRQPLILVYLDGISQEQVAQRLRCPVGTVRSRMSRGRALLKARLTRRGYAPMAFWPVKSLTHPIALLSESVPAPLLSATVRAATQLASTKLFDVTAITASVLSLTKGVLMTMHIAQYKWAAFGLLATTVSAGGAVAVGYTSALESNPISDASTAAASILSESALAQQPKATPATTETPPSVQDQFQPSLAEINALSNRNDRIEALATRMEQALDQYSQASSINERQSPETAARKEVLRVANELRDMAKPLQLRLKSFDEDVRRALLDLGQVRRWKEQTTATLRRMEAIIAKQPPARADDDSLARAKTEDNRATEVLTAKLEQLERIHENRNSDNVTLQQIERHLASLQKRVDRERNFGNPPVLPLGPPEQTSQVLPSMTAAERQPAAAPASGKGYSPLDALQSAVAQTTASELFQAQRQRPAAATSNLDIQMLILPLKQKLEEFQEAAHRFASTHEAASGLARDQLRREITEHMALLSALADDLKNELEQLKQEQQSALAEVERATAKRRGSEIAFLNTKRLFEDKNAVVSATEVAKYESELNAASANLAIAKSNAKKPVIQIRQLELKIKSIDTTIRTAETTLRSAANRKQER